MRNKGKRWLAIVLAAVVSCTNFLMPSGNVLEVFAEQVGDFEIVDGVLNRYTGPGGDVVVPDGVKKIAALAFQNNPGLKSVVIPEGVEEIGELAFLCDTNLTSVSFPDSLKKIGRNIFSSCDKLTSITIPKNVESIDSQTFVGCKGVTSITVAKENTTYDSRENCNAIIETKTNTLVAGCMNTKIPEGVTAIGDFAFSGCKELKAINLPKSLKSIGYSSFFCCSGLSDITYSEGIETIGDSAFFSSGIKVAPIPSSVKSIGECAFSACKEITSVNIPEGITRIEQQTFEHCNKLESLTLPKGLTSIGWNAFYGANIKNVVIPEEVTEIDYMAFYGCAIKSVVIPAGVTKLGGNIFGACDSLESISVDEKNECYDSRENCNAIIETKTNMLISGCKNTVIPEGVEGILGSAFNGCKNLKDIAFPKTVKIINWSAFSLCTGLSSVIIGDGVETIGGFAFSQCDSLKTITIPKNVTNIDNAAFDKDITLVVEEGSYAETYAKENNFKYRTFSVCDIAENPVLEKAAVEELLEKNADNDIVIRASETVEFTFAKGTMSTVEGMENYDFGSTITTNPEEVELPESVPAEDFVAKVSYNYSGKLPGEATIRLFVGKEHIGKRMLYSLLAEDNTLAETQSSRVDKEGFITVKQSHCSAYVVTLAGMVMGDTNDDGNITAEDALSILKNVVGLEELTDNLAIAADVNADGNITAEDALDVLKRVVGLIDHFKAEEIN